MKHIMIVIVGLMIVIPLDGIQAKESNYQQAKQGLYTYYFWIKELCKVYVAFHCFVDYKKIEQAKISCLQCGHVVDSEHICARLIIHLQELQLRKLMRMIYKSPIENIKEYLLQLAQITQMQCFQCFAIGQWQACPA